ncbi:MAG: pentapeptide repeat-containing protein, partial [Armatimonadetes bacterium]|nr:pentapeptide repeat-containing protein [Armatimonadota bacterium]
DVNRARLDSANLGGAVLRRAQLVDSHLATAYLGRADLTEANLWGADLRSADLTRARLCRAQLGKANLSGATLREADLRDAYMPQVIAHGACLDDAFLARFRAAGCDFAGASCRRADFRDYDHREPAWREFGDGEFEKLYGPLFGVEVLLDPQVNIEAVAALVTDLQERWRAAQPTVYLQFEELRVQGQGITALFRSDRELVEAVQQAFLEQIRAAFELLGTPRAEAETTALVSLGGFRNRLVVRPVNITIVSCPTRRAWDRC